MPEFRRSRATNSELSKRIKVAKELIDSGVDRTEATYELSRIYKTSIRQARRYIAGISEGKIKTEIQSGGMNKKAVEGSVYLIIHSKTNLVKIGASIRWEECRSGQVGLNRSTELLRIKKTESFRDIEVEMHKTFDEYRLPASEWFHCDPEEAIKVFDRLIEKYP